MPPIEPLLVLLRVAKEVSAGIPFPGLSAALKISLNIAEKAKEIKDIRDECRSLAERAAYFSLGVYDQLKQCGRDSTPSIAAEERIELLLCILRDIQSLMKRRRKIRALSFIWRHINIAEEIRKLGIQLEDAIRLFVMQTGVEIEQRLDALTSSNARLLQHVEDSARVGDILIGETRGIRTGVLDLAQRIGGGATFDGRFRLFAQENLHLVEPMSDANPLCALPRQAVERALDHVPTKPQSGRVVRYRAIVKAAGELSGSQVIVHMYPDGDNGRFVEAVKSAKQTYHPYILAMLGYSRPGDLGEASYIVTEDYHPFMNYLSSFHGTKKLRVFIKMTSEMCMAADHLEMMELRQLLSPVTYWTQSRVQYTFRLSELVFDHRHGGRFKWARDPLVLEEVRGVSVPAMQAERVRLRDDFRPITRASTDVVVRHWFSRILSGLAAGDHLPERMSWRHWQGALNRPQYTLGAWVGRNHYDKHWSVLPARSPGLEVDQTFERVPYITPWQSSPPEAFAEQCRHSDDEGGEYFAQKMRMYTPFDVTDSNWGEMCVDFELGAGGTRWKRYHFARIPMRSTFLFQRRVHISDRGDAVLRFLRLATGLPPVGYMSVGIPSEYLYHIETTAAVAPHDTEQAFPPLWFFMFQPDDCDYRQDAVHNCHIPFGFWSLDKHPASIPTDIVFDPTPRLERIGQDKDVPLSTWIQQIGDFTFTTQAKMYITIVELSQDERMAARELREDCYCISPSGRDFHDSDDPDSYLSATYNNNEYDGADRDTAGYLDFSDADDRPGWVRFEYADSKPQDATNSEYDDAEEYYSAEEDAESSFGESSTWYHGTSCR